ncbi:hypothetical protein PVAP13_5KG744301 [Panicum virgatum]|uniref:Uncharacterized protein n=1 Tax=Panicum virgatum TaxID=38727 RepID=A0A8T0T1E5_PANVG|nr:hypothetical protein PVAP13_5KG744301 [Panicum virgatum]
MKYRPPRASRRRWIAVIRLRSTQRVTARCEGVFVFLSRRCASSQRRRPIEGARRRRIGHLLALPSPARPHPILLRPGGATRSCTSSRPASTAGRIGAGTPPTLPLPRVRREAWRRLRRPVTSAAAPGAPRSCSRRWTWPSSPTSPCCSACRLPWIVGYGNAADLALTGRKKSPPWRPRRWASSAGSSIPRKTWMPVLQRSPKR